MRLTFLSLTLKKCFINGCNVNCLTITWPPLLPLTLSKSYSLKYLKSEINRWTLWLGCFWEQLLWSEKSHCLQNLSSIMPSSPRCYWTWDSILSIQSVQVHFHKCLYIVNRGLQKVNSNCNFVHLLPAWHKNKPTY